jgi:hypothetical protein
MADGHFKHVEEGGMGVHARNIGGYFLGLSASYIGGPYILVSQPYHRADDEP